MRAFNTNQIIRSLENKHYYLFLLLMLWVNPQLYAYGNTGNDDATTVLSCISDIQVSISPSGTLTLTPQMLLVGNIDNYGNYMVDIEGELDSVLSCAEIDQSFIVSVIDTTNQNSCWSTVHVEDKVKPVISCETLDILCAVDYSTEDYEFFISVSDNCTEEENLEIWYNESITNFNCQPDLAGIVERTWYVTDESGNQSSCEQTINLVKPALDQVVFPSDTTVYCPIPNTNPDSLGVPTIGGLSIDPFCEIVSWNTDTESEICSGSIVITRMWNVMDWCDLTTVTDMQVITILDTTPPNLICPTDFSLSTDEMDCNTTYELPESGATDECGANSLIQIAILIDGIGGYNEGDMVELDLGTHSVMYRATDDCDNVEICTFNIEVIDTISPVLNCLAVVEISTGGDVNLAVDPATFPHIYTDNCNLFDTLIRRVETHCDKPSDLEFGPGISFCCEDVEANVVAEMLVIDESGNSNSCVFEINFMETEPPTVVCKDTIIYLDSMGLASVNTVELYTEIDDNCAVDTVVATLNEFDCSHLGANNVIVTVTDEQGNTGTCISVVTVLDSIHPICVAKDVTISLDNSGNYTLDPLEVDDNSTDGCAIVDYSVVQNTFDCNDIDQSIEVTLTLTDESSNSSDCTANVFVQDTTAPICLTNDITIELSESGTASISPSDIDNSSFDECSGVSLNIDQDMFNCDHVGANSVTLTVADDSGNQSTCESIVTVVDTVFPVALCQDITIQLDANGNYTLEASEVDNGSSDNCIIANLDVDPDMLDCSNINSVIVTLTVEDESNNSSSCTSNVTVQDTTAPMAICQDITITLDMNGMYTLRPDEVDGGSSDACDDVLDLEVNPDQFDCADIGDLQVTLTVTDDSGNASFCMSIVTIVDTLMPMCVTQDITIYLDDSGVATIDSNAVDGGSSDPCGMIVEIATDPNSFTCANLGLNMVTMTVTDDQGNSSSCDAIVEIQDTTSPVCMPVDVTISLDEMQMATITAQDVDGGSSDNCNSISLDVTPNTFDCSDIGTNDVTLTVTDPSTNSSTCIAVVTVQDTTPPIAMCRDITLDLGPNGSGTITALQIDNGSSDDCTMVSLSINIEDFFCNDVGNNTVVLTVSDESGNSSSCTGNVFVRDIELPNAVCQDITIQLDNNGMVTIEGLDVNNGSTDNCTIISMEVDPNEFNCTDLGPNNVTLTVEDINGNIGTCLSTVTVEDTIPPNALCQDITVQLDNNGNATITGLDIDGGSTDNCQLGLLLASPSNFDCTDLGPVTTTLFVEDNSSNMSSCEATVTVADTVPPVAICQDITLQLDVNGSATLIADSLDNNSTDNCLVVSFAANPISFTCSELGTNDVTLLVTDGSGNTDSCMAIVTVEDTIPPVALCQDITVQLDATGNASILGSDVDGGSTDNCLVSELIVNPSIFNCMDIGDVNVVLTVRDNSVNESTCQAIVTVQDTVTPSAICQDITVQLDGNGMIQVDPGEVDGDSDDACGISGLNLSPDQFDCSNVGDNVTILTVTDNNGNVSTCTSTINVQDTVPPIALCQDITIQLDANGNASIQGSDINAGSSDACIVISLLPDISDFNCSNVGPNNVILTVTDANNNESTCGSVVTVQDTTPPLALCQDIIVQLNASGNITVTAEDVDNGSNDACGISSLSLIPDQFTCAEVGDNPVTLTVEDVNSNSSSCNATVNVQDTVSPVAICQDLTIQLDINGMGSITAAEIDDGSTDACGPLQLQLDQTDFDCTNLGSNTVQLTVSDANSNMSTCGAEVLVEDNIAPMPLCQDVTIYVDDAGVAVLDPTDVDNGSTDNCNNLTLSVDITDYSCNNVGTPTSVVLTVSDLSGNSDTCTALVSVADTTSPIALCQDITIQLDNSGNAVITGLDINNGSSDNCGIASILPSPQTFDCSDIGDNDVILTVTDINGNSDTCLSIVTVQDTTPPMALCQDVTVQLDAAGTSNLTAALVDNGSSDLCGSVMLSIDNSSFTCADLGPVPIILTVTDESGNISTCASSANVEDIMPPTAVCQDVTVQLEADGDLILFGSLLDGGSTDNCNVVSLLPNPGIVDCNDIGDITVVLRVADQSGNSSTCSSMVTVEDVTPPVAVCNDLTIILDEIGEGTITPDQVDGGSTDECDSSLELALNFTTFFCNDVGDNTVTLTVTDDSGNSDSCFSTITVLDTIAPVCNTMDITITLDDSGNASLDSNAVNNASSDPCGFITEFATSPNTFTCADIGDVTVTMTVTDNSGNLSSCTAIVTVEDTSPPTIECTDVTIEIEVDETATVSVNDILISGSDNCSAEENLLLTFDPANPDSTISVFTCNDLGIQSLVLYVSDESGNQSTCDAQIEVVDPNSNCPPGFTGTVEGRVMSELAEPVDEYEVTLFNDEISETREIGAGGFSFEGLELEQEYFLEISKNTGWKNGLTLLDYDLIISHLLQENPFDNPQDYIAADLDNNKRVSALDAVWLKRLLLDFNDSMSGNESWRFVDMYYDFGSSNPLDSEVPEIISFSPLKKDELHADFMAIKTGDIDGDSKKTGFKNDHDTFGSAWIFNCENQSFSKGDFVNLNLELCVPDCDINGLQLALNLEDFKFIGFDASSYINPADFNYLEKDNLLKMILSKYEYEFDEMQSINIQLLALVDGKLDKEKDNLIIQGFSRFYDNQQKAHDVELNFIETKTELPTEMELMVSPNPFTDQFKLDITNDQTGYVSIEIFDSYGRKVYTGHEFLEIGKSSYQIHRTQLGAAGIYHVIVVKGNQRLERKIILIN